MESIDHLSDDETGKAIVLANFRAIHRGHVLAYAKYALSAPSDMTAKDRQESAEAVIMFASLGWCCFHAMNKGEPIKDKPAAKRAARTTKKKKASS